MKPPRTLLVSAAMAVVFLLPTSSSAMELDGFLAEIDLRASADIGAFRADLSASFDVSSGEVDGLFEIFTRPADVYIALRIGEVCDEPIDRVVAEYRANKGRGWGAIAKNLGIKPGSPEFHALKHGRLSAQARSAPPDDTGKGSSKSKGKGKGKGRN